MAKKFLLILMAAILLIPCVAFAKKDSAKIPQDQQLNIAIEVTDATNFKEINTRKILADKLIVTMYDKHIFNIVGVGDGSLADIKVLKNSGTSDVGDLVMFPTKDLEFDKETFKDMGAQYVIRCEILGLGMTKETDGNFGFGNGIEFGIGGGSVGIGIYNSGGRSLRNLYCTAVNMQIVEVESGEVVARQNLVGKGVKHKKTLKGYENAIDEAYLKSLDDATKIITKRFINFAADNFKQYEKFKDKK